MALYRAKADGRGTLPLLRAGDGRAAAGAAARWRSTCARRCRSERVRAVLPAAGQPRRRTRSPASRRCCAGAIPSAAWCSPAEFIPLAEEIGLIAPIGEWVLQPGLRRGGRAGRTHVRVAVNLSPLQFQQRQRWCSSVIAARSATPACRRAGSSSRSPSRSCCTTPRRRSSTLHQLARARRAHLDGRFRHRLFVA